MMEKRYIYNIEYVNKSSIRAPCKNPRPTDWLKHDMTHRITLKGNKITVVKQDEVLYGTLAEYSAWPPLTDGNNKKTSLKYKLTHFSTNKNIYSVQHHHSSPSIDVYISADHKYAEIIYHGSGVYILSWYMGKLTPVA